MEAHELSRKYATAIFSLALEKWINPLRVVQEKLTPDRLEELQDTSRPFEERQKELDQLVPKESQPEVSNFLYTLLQEGHLDLLGQTMDALERMVEGGPEVQVAYITTAIELTDSEKEKFRQKLRSQYGEYLEFDFSVDPGLLGGAIVRIGDEIIDGSVAARLEAMSNALGVRN